MIDKISMTPTNIPYMNAQAQSSLATGLTKEPTQPSLRTQLLEQADKVFSPDRVQTSFPEEWWMRSILLPLLRMRLRGSHVIMN